MPIPIDEPPIKRHDSTPTIADQCKAEGWGYGIYDFGKAEAPNITYFNPSIVEREDGLWLLVRRSENAGTIFGMNNIWAMMLDDTGKIPKMGHLLQWPESKQGQQYEDARAFYHPGLKQTCVGATSFIWRDDGSWTGAHQVVGFFDQDWTCKVKHDPVFGGNADHLAENIEVKNYEKSWVWFLHRNKLHLLYKPAPWIVAEFGDTWEDRKVYESKGLSWNKGQIRNGTPPILIDGLLYSFFHSSLPWQGNYRRYYQGTVAFEPESPYKPVLMTPEPLLAGSQNDEWQVRKPPCIFPCGAIFRNGTWLITAGQNDLKAVWIEMSHESLLAKLKPMGAIVTQILPPTGLSDSEIRINRLRANAAKARAARKDKCLDCDKLARWLFDDGIKLCDEHAEYRKSRDANKAVPLVREKVKKKKRVKRKRIDTSPVVA